MSWELLAIIASVIIVVLMVIFRKRTLVKKYWKYTLILAPALFIIILRLIVNKKDAKRDEDIEESASALSTAISDIKEDIQEVTMTAAVEVSAAKSKDAVKVEELHTVVKIKDKRERRKRLAAMIG